MMKTIKARRFLECGLQVHDRYFNPEDAEGNRLKTVSEPAPRNILFDPEFTEELEFELRIPVVLPDAKWEMAKVLSEAFGDQFSDHLYDAGLWNWITFYYAHDVLGGEPSPENPLPLRERVAYSIYPRGAARATPYRHRLFGPAFMWNRFGEAARICLTGDKEKMSDVLDAVCLINLATAEVLRAIDALFFDRDADALLVTKRTSSKKTLGQLRAGGVRDCLAHIAQIATTRALHLLTAEQIVKSLPREEFGEHIDRAMGRLAMRKVSDCAA